MDLKQLKVFEQIIADHNRRLTVLSKQMEIVSGKLAELVVISKLLIDKKVLTVEEVQTEYA